MIGLDTNVLIRYLAQDDPRQSPLATRFIEKRLSASEPGFIALVVVAEVVWVLVSLYEADRRKIVEVLEGILTTEQLRVESAELVRRALRRFERSKADFSDALIAESTVSAGCSRSVTFDRNAATTAGFELLSS